MMRLARISALVGVVVLCPVVASAGPWQWGLKGGLSLTGIHGDFAELAEPKSKLGFQGGGLLEFSPGPIGIGLEVLYVQKGFALESAVSDNAGNFLGTFESRLQLTYVEVPVLARGSLKLEGPVEPYAIFGPTFGFALGGTFERDAPGTEDADVGGELKAMDVGMASGLGIRIGRGPSRLAVEARYSTGFDDLWDVARNFESINHGFGITVAWIRQGPW